MIKDDFWPLGSSEFAGIDEQTQDQRCAHSIQCQRHSPTVPHDLNIHVTNQLRRVIDCRPLYKQFCLEGL